MLILYYTLLSLSSIVSPRKERNSVCSPNILLFTSFHACTKDFCGLSRRMTDRRSQGNSTVTLSFLSRVRKSRLTGTRSPQAHAPAGTGGLCLVQSCPFVPVLFALCLWSGTLCWCTKSRAAPPSPRHAGHCTALPWASQQWWREKGGPGPGPSPG